MLNSKKMLTKILTFGMRLPDYNNAEALSFSWDTNVTIQKDGYIIATMNSGVAGALMAAYVNNVPVWAQVTATNDVRSYIGMFPVCKGDVVKFTSAYSPTGTAKLVPCK